MSVQAPTTRIAELRWRGAPLQLAYQWVGVSGSTTPVVVFLHEGLGSIELWKDYPDKFCREHGFTGLVFSRYGYGQSTPRPSNERFPVDFMHTQAHEVLPALLASLGITKPWLYGHSDGGSIALLYAARFPEAVTGIVVAAPHIFVEPVTVQSIAEARTTYLSTGLRDKLARYHADPDSAFWGWNDVWLDPDFLAWNIEAEVKKITCPLLAVQGEDDEYGTLEQIYGIKRAAPQARLIVLPKCGHSPHRDQAEALNREVAQFILSAS